MTTNINADNGVVSGIAGLKTSADNSGVLALQTNGTTALTVDTLQNVGIGRTPVTYGSFKVLDVAGSSGAIQKWVHTGSSVQLQAYASSSVTAVGSATNHPLTLVTNDTERLRLNTSGTVILQGGSTSATGVGITFPATQSASSDANTLDDYEEGTWTCAITTGGGSITMNTSFDTGAYTKVGRLVTITGEFRVSSVSSPSGTAIIALPFTVAAATERSTYPTASLWMEGASQNMNTYFIQATPSTTNLYIFAMGTNSFANAANNFSGDELLFITFTYFTT